MLWLCSEVQLHQCSYLTSIIDYFPIGIFMIFIFGINKQAEIIKNRGKQSNDDKLFAPKWHTIFTEAADDFSYLLTRGYGTTAALQVVGNRYRLTKRQREALSRIGCGEPEIKLRQAKELQISDLKGQELEIDGFNLLILIESLLSGAYIFKARDGLYRDISSVHGSYRRVAKTEESLLMIGSAINKLEVKHSKWYFDQPVSNSGRLKTRLYEMSESHGFNWDVELVFDPDKELIKSKEIVISSDGWILDQAERWFNLGAYIINSTHTKPSNILAL